MRGELRAGGTLRVDSRTDQSCGPKVGTLARGETSLEGASRTSAAPAATGPRATGSPTRREDSSLPPPADIVKNASGAVFDGFSLSDADLSALRAFAKARGTYLQGAVRFGAGNRMPDGLIFVDTISGEMSAADTSPHPISPPWPSTPGAPADPSGVWRGWLIVNGSLAVDGDVRLRGFVYAQSTLALGRREPPTLGRAGEPKHPGLPGAGIDTGPAADLSIVYNCRDALTGGGKIPGRWSVKGGSYREVSGS